MTTQSDLLYGVNSIAEHLNLTRRQVYHMHDQGQLPTFKQGRIVCARRSTLAKHFEDQERLARKGGANA
ncbi:MAG: DNA-binding protein [Pseudomonadota bacterium]|nr:DNA-binding protein [Pseudomonadota bacterium]